MAYPSSELNLFRDATAADYPPWTWLEDLRRGRLVIDDGPRAGVYDVAWL